MSTAFWGSIIGLALIILIVVALVLMVLRYRQSVASQQQTATELRRLDDRVASIENMLRDVG